MMFGFGAAGGICGTWHRSLHAPVLWSGAPPAPSRSESRDGHSGRLAR